MGQQIVSPDGRVLEEGVDFVLRYVVGIGVQEPTEEGGRRDPNYSVVVFAETQVLQERLGQQVLISGMNAEQTEHLWMQLGRALGKPEAFD